MEELRRALAILVRPARTWAEIAAAPVEPRPLMVRYVAPLAVIPAVCGLAGPLLFAFAIASVRVAPNPVSLGLQVVASYVLSVAAVVLLALWVALIAPAFGARRDLRLALNLVAHAGTAAWVAGVFALYPSLDLSARILGYVASLYLLYLGLPALTRVDEERRLTFFAAILIVVLILAVAVGGLAGWVATLGGPLRVV
jgi:hypothetical protein